VNPDKLAFIAMNLVGGCAVLASYALWLATPSNDGPALWGSIAGTARTVYTVSMFAAASGYFAFAGYLLLNDVQGLPFAWVLTLFAFILFPSALWMPLAFEYLATPGAALWWAMRVTLAIVGLASLALVFTLARLTPTGTAQTLAVAGAIAFTFQTLVLDALVWPLYFPR
jgi:hypothetical protein